MSTATNRAGFWNDQVCAAIDAAVKTSVGAIRVRQKVFPTIQLTGVTSVPADVFNPARMSIEEGIALFRSPLSLYNAPRESEKKCKNQRVDANWGKSDLTQERRQP
jgi:hypothetical protein